MYRHTQTGTVIPVVIVASTLASLLVLLVVPLGLAPGFVRWLIALTLGVALAAAALFRSLTIAVGDGVLSWSFGPGLIRKSVAVADVSEVEPVRTSIAAGWGIHRTRAGWLYNVAGRQAVRVRLRSGKQFVLGTDEPARLIEAIRRAQAAGR